jgi:hypothetical protein
MLKATDRLVESTFVDRRVSMTVWIRNDHSRRWFFEGICSNQMADFHTLAVEGRTFFDRAMSPIIVSQNVKLATISVVYILRRSPCPSIDLNLSISLTKVDSNCEAN